MKIAPSLLSCDFSKMGEEIERMDLAGADFVDVIPRRAADRVQRFDERHAGGKHG